VAERAGLDDTSADLLQAHNSERAGLDDTSADLLQAHNSEPGSTTRPLTFSKPTTACASSSSL